MGRLCRITAAVCLPLLIVSVAHAAKIDPGLKKLLDDKARVETIPVLMVFPDPPALEDVEVQLEGATPEKRRKSMIAALKRRVRKAQTEAWEILSAPDHPGTLVSADMLYLANAIAFEGDREIILAVAETKNPLLGDVVLYHDEALDLLTGLGPREGAGLKAAQQDTVWNLQAIGADRVWREFGLTGEGVLIGHIDTGVDLAHPDLRHRLWVNPAEVPGNGVDDDGNGLVDDVTGWDFGDGDPDPADDAAVAGHGTHTAGTLVGDGAGGIQTGVAPGARLIPVKVFASGGQSSLGRIWAAQQYCVEQGARVISMSLGVKGDIPAGFLRNDRFAGEALRAAGILLVNSAGNYHDEFDPPLELGMTARIPSPWNPLDVARSSTGGVVSVGGLAHRSDEVYASSSRGPVAWGDVEPWHDWPYAPGPGLIKPDLAAPAEGIGSTLPGGGYSGQTWSGTSMAAPHVAGTAALMLQKNPTLSPAGLDSLMQLSARDLGAAGKDPVFGSGALDAYAAVQAVPLDLLPNLDGLSFVGDPQGNAVLDPGEMADLVFKVQNVGSVAATGVVGQLRIPSNPHVAVTDGTASFADIAAGAVGDNAAQPFELLVSPAAPQGATFGMELILQTAEGFQRSFDLVGHVGRPQWRNLDASDVYLTVTSRGSLGYLTDAQEQGAGMGLAGLPSSLFMGSLWGGTHAAYLCNSDLTGGGADVAEWTPRLAPTGNVTVVRDDDEAQALAVAFTDSGHTSPRGVTVELVATARTAPALARAVILEYEITNHGTQFLGNYRVGLFLDWDVVDLLGNVGGVVPDQRAVWVGMPGGPVFGHALLGDAPLSNATLIDNPTYVFPVSHVIDVHKQQLLGGTIHQAEATLPTDLSALVAAGPFALGPGESVRVAFVLAYGATVDDFLAGVAAAEAGAGAITAVEPGVPGEDLPAAGAARLAQNHPNPFNPSTEIRFSLPRAGTAELAVYDLFGRRVRTLVQGELAAGPHAVRWDGRDEAGERLPSGMYLYRLLADGTTFTRKAVLVK